MKTFKTTILLLLVFTLTELFAQNNETQNRSRFRSVGYTVPIELSEFRVKDGVAHSLTAYFGLKQSNRTILGVVGTVGYDLDTPIQHIRQQMVAASGFARYLIQNQSVKSYLEVMAGVGYFRERFIDGKDYDPAVWEVVGDLFFTHLNVGGGIDIPIGKTKWYFGFAGALSSAVHKDGISSFFVPRIVVSRY